MKRTLEQSRKAPILNLILKGKSIIVDACDGLQTLSNSDRVFPLGVEDVSPVHVGGNLKNWRANEVGIATTEQAVDVYELTSSSTFMQMLDSFETELSRLCLTQSQIVNFCEEHPNWLRKDGYPTFFLFKDQDQFYVVGANVLPDGLCGFVFSLSHKGVWPAECSFRLVIPQLAK